MASSSLPIAPGAPDASEPGRALFELGTPICVTDDGEMALVHGLDMRTIGSADLPLLDRFHGQPIALAHNLIAALCDITPIEAQQLALDDFTMLASEVFFEVEEVSQAMGLPARFFLGPDQPSAPIAPVAAA